MFNKFFYNLRNANIPVTLLEYLTLLRAVKLGLSEYKVNKFYYLARTCLVKDERNLDKFDLVFAKSFEGVEYYLDYQDSILDIPAEWLRSVAERVMTAEEMAKVKKRGGFEKLIEELQKRLNEQEKRHEGGSKWIGTGGTSPFGHGGYNPEGIRIGGKSENQRAIKVWEKRIFKDLDQNLDIGTRNIKIALKRLRRFARQGSFFELDLEDTIKSTAKNAGYLDIKMIPEKKNIINLLLFFDVGGSMNPYVQICEELFSAAKAEFKHLKFFYFHNFIYESLWENNSRRENERINLFEILNTYSKNYKVIIVGDASMSPYEIFNPGGSVEHWNDESGEIWMNRLINHYEKFVWLNPMGRSHWDWTPSVNIIKKMVDDKMFPLTLSGLEDAMVYLSR